MSPFFHETLSDQSGGVCDEETEDQCGVPERLGSCQQRLGMIRKRERIDLRD